MTPGLFPFQKRSRRSDAFQPELEFFRLAEGL